MKKTKRGPFYITSCIIITLLQIVCRVHQWKNFENRSIIGEDIDKSKVPRFLWPTVYITSEVWLVIVFLLDKRVQQITVSKWSTNEHWWSGDGICAGSQWGDVSTHPGSHTGYMHFWLSANILKLDSAELHIQNLSFKPLLSVRLFDRFF